MAQVPFDRFSDTSAKCLLGFPSELSAQLRRVDCISTIMARTICHELDQGCMWSKARIGQDLIHCLAGQPGGARADRLLYQARLALDDDARLRVVRKMYALRFGEEADGAGRSDFEQTSPQVRPMRLQVAVPEVARDRRAGVP